MKDGFYPIGTKVRFIEENSIANCHPSVGTIGTIIDHNSFDRGGAWIKWPKGSTRWDGRTYCSYIFLELVEEKEMTIKINEPVICSDCGCVIEDGNGFELSSGRIVCEDCLDDYAYCECCEQYVECDTEEVDGEIVCEDCLSYYDDRYFQCAECNEWHRASRYDRIEIWNGDYICESCFEDYYARCEDCGDVYHVDDMTYVDYEGYYCASCMRDKHKIHDYSYKPEPVFKTGPSYHDVFYNSHSIKELLFGVELEIDQGNDPEDCAEDLTDACDDIYCKHDGSLDEGVEIVTHPCTLNYHLNHLGWSRLCQIARDHDFLSNDARTCGLHVHVGRYQLGETWDERDEVVAKIVMLVERHWDTIVKFSRRKESQLHWAVKPEFEYEEDEAGSLREALQTRSNGRYQAVNLTNSDTIEFRVFNGTLKPSTIFATLQFVNNICKYAMKHSVEEVMASQWDDIIETEVFVSLAEYLKERNIVAEKIAAIQFKQVWHPQVGDRVFSNFGNGAGQVGTVVAVRDNSCYDYKDIEVLVAYDLPQAWMHDNRHMNGCKLEGELTEPVGYWYEDKALNLDHTPEGEEKAAIYARIAHLAPWVFSPAEMTISA